MVDPITLGEIPISELLTKLIQQKVSGKICFLRQFFEDIARIKSVTPDTTNYFLVLHRTNSKEYTYFLIREN